MRRAALVNPPHHAGAASGRGGPVGWLPLAIGIVLVCLFGVGVSLADDPPVVLAVAIFVTFLVLGTWHLEVLLVGTTLAFFLPSTGAAQLIPQSDLIRWIMLGSMLVVCLLKVAMDPTARRRPAGRIPLPLIAFSALVLISTIWSVDRVITLGRASSFVSVLVLGVLLPKLGFGGRQLERAFRAVAVITAVLDAAVVVLGVSGLGGRYYGIFGNPNYLGVADALLFAVTAAGALESRNGRAFWLYGSISSLLVLESVLAGSRGGLLAMATAFAFLIWSSGWAGRVQAGTWWRLAIVIATLPLLALLVTLASVDLQARITSTDNSRATLWAVFPSLFSGAPILGHGFGSTEHTLVPFLGGVGYQSSTGVELHNSYLNLLNELGLVGGVIIVALLGLVALRIPHSRRSLGGIVVAGLVSATFESWLFSIGSGFPITFWLSVMSITLFSQSEPQVGVRSRRGGPAPSIKLKEAPPWLRQPARM